MIEHGLVTAKGQPEQLQPQPQPIAPVAPEAQAEDPTAAAALTPAAVAPPRRPVIDAPAASITRPIVR